MSYRTLLLAALLPLLGGAKASAPAPAALEIKLFAFAPKTLTVVAGESIAVTNGDAIEHTVTFGAPDKKDPRAEGAALKPSGSATITAPRAAGTYAFYCERHPFMTGTLTVTAP